MVGKKTMHFEVEWAGLAPLGVWSARSWRRMARVVGRAAEKGTIMKDCLTARILVRDEGDMEEDYCVRVC